MSDTWMRLRRTLVFSVVIFAFAVTTLLAVLATVSFAGDAPVRLVFNRYGERFLELWILWLVVGVMPFALLVIDDQLRTDNQTTE